MSEDPVLEYGQPLAAAAGTHVGKRRKQNEDRVLVRGDLGLYLVADGAGGHNAGEVASRIAVEIVEAEFAASTPPGRSRSEFDRIGIAVTARRLSLAIHRANAAVLEASRTTTAHRGMGSTIVAVAFSRDASLIHVAHVGDSRCYRLRGGHLEALTQDHSVATDVLEQRPDLDDQVLSKLPKNAVTRALGMPDVRVSVRTHGVVAGDRYLLCSDGLSGPVAAPDIATALGAPASAETIVEDLIERANAVGGPDNIAAVVIDCSSGPELALPASWTPDALDASQFPDGADSDPELLILGIEDFDLSELTSTANDGLMGAIGQLLRKSKDRS